MITGSRYADSHPDMEKEAISFDRQIEERVRNGHIPDLRLAQPCDFFYNNSWRRPEYARLDMGEQCALLVDALRAYAPKSECGTVVLEVGCGPGHLSLELARNGFNVTGIDLSLRCIEIAESYSRNDPWRGERGKLRYLAGDFLTAEKLQSGAFGAIVFVGSLHHFRDQRRVMERSLDLLNSDGMILAHEPTRDRVTLGNAALIHLLRVLLSAGGGYHAETTIPADVDEHMNNVARLLSDLKYEDMDGEKLQSVLDNVAGHKDMYGALKEHFDELIYQERYAFFHEMIGGLRFDEETNVRLAGFLRDADSLLCKLGVLQSTEYFFVGRRKG